MSAQKLRHTLEILIDQDLYALIPMIRKDGLITITLRNVEAGGIWIENGDLRLGVSRHPDGRCVELEDLPPTVCFVPWPQIGYIVAGDAASIRKSQLLHFSPRNVPLNPEPLHQGGES